MTYTKHLIPAVFLFATSISSFAEDYNDVSGHRIGLGYSNTDLVVGYSGLDWGDGIKLEYGYDINRIVGINLSYQNNSNSAFGADIDGNNVKFDTDLGYMFSLDGWSIKPYGAVGLVRVDETISFANYTPDSFTETSLMGGLGVRATLDMGVYADLRYDFYNVESVDMDQLSITFGYKF